MMPESQQSNPEHIAIIMDGNGRWAQQKGLPAIAGHKAGVDSVRNVAQACKEAGVRILTLFAFSSENWNRPQPEVTALMRLFNTVLRGELRRLQKNGIRLRVIGNRDRFSPGLVKRINEAEQKTQHNEGTTLVIAADYGGQWDITQATQKIASLVIQGVITPSEITPRLIQEHLSLGDLPYPDLCIRTGCEKRISNFMLWQCAYTELYFTDVYWPEFGKTQLQQAICEYQQRSRRFGRTDHRNT